MTAARHLQQAVREGASLRAVMRARIRAASSEDVQRARFALEDALNTADFGDCGRLIVVRALALGRLPAGASGWVVARTVEEAWRRMAGRAVPFSSAAAADAPAIYFSSLAQARVAYVRAVVHRKGVSAWFWPRALPELDGAENDTEAVVLVLGSMAPEDAQLLAEDAAHWTGHAFAALDALLPAAPSATLRRRLDALVFATDPRPVVASATVSVQGPTASSSFRAGDAIVRAARALQSRGWTAMRSPADWRHAWVSALVIRSVLGEVPASALVEQAVREVAVRSMRHAEESAQRNSPRLAPADERMDEGRMTPSAGMPADSLSEVAAHRPEPSMPRSVEAKAGGPQVNPEPAAQDGTFAQVALRPHAPWICDALPTAFAGLPMLLTVLDALGMPRWLELQPPHVAKVFARAWLRHIADRLQLPAADGMRLPLALAPDEEAALDAGTACWAGFAWPAWSDAPLPQTTRGAAWAAFAPWRVAVRRALRRHGGLGIASLCRRPGLVAGTSTHVDVTLPLEAADLRVRRAGLDRDPGWVPWFGRIVAFHFVGREMLDRDTDHG
jgi:hypothetical protein